MFLLKFLASIFLIIVVLALFFAVGVWAWIRNMKRQFDRLGRSGNNPSGNSPNGARRQQHSNGDSRRTTVNADEGEYIDFEEVDAISDTQPQP